jgi:hypothetical protein
MGSMVVLTNILWNTISLFSMSLIPKHAFKQKYAKH